MPETIIPETYLVYLIQQLAGMAMDAGGYAAKPPTSSGRVKKEFRSLQTRVIRAAEAARRVAYKLHPSELDDLGLEAALRLHSEEFGRREHIDVKFSAQNLPPAVSPEIASCLYRVAQESLRNIAKHAKAKQVTVLIDGAAGRICLCVTDAGVGFPVPSLRTTTGLGILSMKERVQLVNGRFLITSERSKGTKVTVEVPLSQ